MVTELELGRMVWMVLSRGVSSPSAEAPSLAATSVASASAKSVQTWPLLRRGVMKSIQG